VKTPINREDFANWVKSLKHRYTTYELWKLTGVHFTTWQRYEAGTTLPSPEKLEKIAQVLGCHVAIINDKLVVSDNDGDYFRKLALEQEEVISDLKQKLEDALNREKELLKLHQSHIRSIRDDVGIG